MRLQEEPVSWFLEPVFRFDIVPPHTSHTVFATLRSTGASKSTAIALPRECDVRKSAIALGVTMVPGRESLSLRKTTLFL